MAFAEAKALYDFGEGIANAAIQVKGKEAEEYSKYLTREPSNEAADSVKSKEDTHEKGSNGRKLGNFKFHNVYV